MASSTVAAAGAAAADLERIVKEARNAFIIAKSDGVLDAGEVVQIALIVAKGVQKISSLSGSEKKAIVLLALKRGLEAAGGLPPIKGATPEAMAVVEKQLFGAAVAAVDAALAVASGKLDLRKPSAWKSICLPLCSAAAAAAVVAVPKDQPILRDAVAFATEKVVETTAVVLESAAPAVPPVSLEDDASQTKAPEKEPSLQASSEALPASLAA